MPVEVRGLPQHRNNAIDSRELDERVDRAIVHSRREKTERKADTDFGAEAIAPSGLVLAQARFVQIVVTQRLVERLGSELTTDQAVVDSPAGGRLDQSGRVADGEEPR